jgi:general stress protein 26
MKTDKSNQAGGAERAHQKFHDLSRSFDTAILVTHAKDGSSHARPMAVADVTDTGDLWFVSRQDSEKVDELVDDPRALVVMQGSAKHLVVNGHAELKKDPAKVEALWKEQWKVWFKDKHDPNLVLIHLQPDEAEYWDNSGTDGLKFFLKAASAYLSGRELKGTDDPDIHAKVRA